MIQNTIKSLDNKKNICMYVYDHAQNQLAIYTKTLNKK